MRTKEISLSGWGNSSKAKTKAFRVETKQDVIKSLETKKDKNGVIAYGLGRSYGDVALNDGGHTILTPRLNRIVSFDRKTGEIVAQSGVSFDDLMKIFLPQGFMPPVTPGTSFVTIGGAIANDVHGKNHDKAGSFGSHVKWIELVLPNGEIKILSPQKEKELFFATIGGIGLTGIILKACFDMVKINSSYVDVRKTKIKNIDHYFIAFEQARKNKSFTVGWIDCLSKGKNLGRGIFETADISNQNNKKESFNPLKVSVPFNFPNIALNPLSINLFNKFYYNHILNKQIDFTQHMQNFFYPLDKILNWNRIYGKRGFFQFQFVIPEEQGFEGIKKLLEEITKSKKSSFLAVIKTLGNQGDGLLSFPKKGYTLALDFPNVSGIKDFLESLEKITLDYDGRLYLGKDAVMKPYNFEKMYPKIDQFREIINEIDPERKMSSDMSKRLKI